MGNNEVMPGIDGALHVVTDRTAAATTRGHRAGIGIGQRDLFVFALHHSGVQLVQTTYLLAQGRDLLVEPRDLGLRHRFALAIGAIELREVAGDALVDLRQPPRHLGLREVAVPRVDSLELAAVYRNAHRAEQLEPPAQHHELSADLADGLAVVLAEVGYRLEVRHQPAGQQHQLEVALALALKAPARLHSIEVAVDIDLQQRRWMIGRPSRRLRLDPAKAEFGQIKLIDKDIDRPDRIVLAQIFIQPLGKQRALTAVIANHKTRHPILRPNLWRIVSSPPFSHSLDPERAFAAYFRAPSRPLS